MIHHESYIAVVSNVGHLLIFPINELPQLAKGKGNKIINIPSAKVASREEFVKDLAVLHEQDELLILGDSRPFTLKPKDWKNFVGTRAQRGAKLPRGCRHVKGLQVKSS
jgi:topoisomerase-4 subunit A